jgi:octaprenyl-diphosphate synthase
LRRFGDHLGMAFQIIDDLIDYTEEEATTGKPSGSDLREQKVTLPLIHALPRLNPSERRIIDDLMTTAEPSDDLIGEVIGLVTDAGGLDYARERAQWFCDQAEAELEALPPCPAREALRLSLAYLLERRS